MMTLYCWCSTLNVP